MRSRTFLYKIQLPTTFMLSFLWDTYFRQHWVLSRMYSAVSVYCISTIFIIRAPYLHLGGGDRHMRSRTFLYEIQFPTTFMLSFFSWDGYFWRQRFMCILAHILTQAMSTAMTSLYVTPCESGPPVFLITLHLLDKYISMNVRYWYISWKFLKNSTITSHSKHYSVM